jgi:PAS domain S-box-containing protein
MADRPTRILVVDDDEMKRYTLTRILQRAGFEIAEGTTGGDALQQAARFDLLVLDVKLPDTVGYDVCRRLKADPATASTPVLLMSATFVGADSQVQGLESGADAFLTDATEPPVLIATVQALIRMRRAEEKTRELARQWQATFDAITDGVFLADTGGRLVRANRALGDLVGRPVEELIGRPMADLHPALPTGTDAPFAIALTDRRRATAEVRAGDRWFRLTIDPVLLSGSSIGGAVGLLADVTERRRVEEALRDADRAKDEFLAMLAHELRNPLAPIRTALEIQQQTGADQEVVRRSREMMARQLGNMVRLIEDLLDVGRITKGRIELRRERVTLGSVLDAAVETSRPLIESARHELTVDVPAEPVVIDADPTRIVQVISNLLNNAAKYTPEGGRIRLSATRERDEAVVRVADTGVGIVPEMLPRVWGLFTQGDRSLGRSQGGLGVGLTLVKRLVELHGGTVEAHSGGPGTGSEFVVRLPVAGGPDTVPRSPPVSPPAAQAPRRILVVDDNTDGAETLSILLSLSGHTVRVANDGPTALVAAGEFRPDVVLLDIGLPGLDGYEVARRLRARPEFRSTRLVALTGWGQQSDRERSRAAGFDYHAVKPIDPGELRKVLAASAPEVAPLPARPV